MPAESAVIDQPHVLRHEMPTLGIGVVSRNVVDATIEQAYRHGQRLMLIASRRQVESRAFGGGYVEHWTPETLADYVRARDPQGLIVLCRDHGGPWQNPMEQRERANERSALDAALGSFQADVEAGFELLHIDSSAELAGAAAHGDAVRRLLWLYRACHESALEHGRKVLFEIGFETQSAAVADPQEFAAQVQEVGEALSQDELPAPTFIVAQTATKVVETRNVGDLVRDQASVCRTIRELARACRRAGAGLKAHNADYLQEGCLRALSQSGVGAINVAPELGVAETCGLLALFARWQATELCDEFLGLAFESRAWEKWLAPDSSAGDLQKATLAGHYVFATAEFAEMKQRLLHVAGDQGGDIDEQLRRIIGSRIESLLSSFGPAPARTPAIGARAQ